MSSSNYFPLTGLAFQDYAGTTGANLLISVPGNGTYNVSINRTLTLGTQQWQIAVVGDISVNGATSVGGGAGSTALTPPNAVVQNIILGPNAVPANILASDFAQTTTYRFTGPLP